MLHKKNKKGERTLKASSQIETVYQNGQIASASTTIGLYTTYVNPYMVVDADQRYSKHYFNGSQRVVSKMGEQDASIFENTALPIAPQTQNTERQTENSTNQSSEDTVDFEAIRSLQITDFNYYLTQNTVNATAKSVKVKYKTLKKENSETERASENSTQALPDYVEMYYYHSDHLGSGTFLSDYDGNPYQFFLNLPFGETMIEQHSYSGDYTNRYKFNGKELDEETGFYYYGARYYNPRFSIWLSTDPLAQSFPNWNPYNYTMQNPINLTDPTGMSPEGGDGNPLSAIFGGGCGKGSSQSSGSSSDWQNLDKKTLFDYVKKNYCPNCSDGTVNQMAGIKFEKSFNEIMKKQLVNYNYKANSTMVTGSYKGKDRNTVPDGKFDLIRYRFMKLKIGPLDIPTPVRLTDERISGVQFAEVKATNGTLYNSYNQGQLHAMISAMGSNSDVHEYGGEFLFGTTSDTKVSEGLRLHAKGYEINIIHTFSKYRMVNGQMQINFFQSGIFGDVGTPYFSILK